MWAEHVAGNDNRWTKRCTELNRAQEKDQKVDQTDVGEIKHNNTQDRRGIEKHQAGRDGEV